MKTKWALKTLLLALASAGVVAGQSSTPAQKDAPAHSAYALTKAFEAAAKFVPVKQWRGINDLQKEFYWKNPKGQPVK